MKATVKSCTKHLNNIIHGDNMAKKYKLVIPEMIKREDVTLANNLINSCLNGKTLHPNADGVIIDWNVTAYHMDKIPKEWLQEIKEPVSFDVYMLRCNYSIKTNTEYYSEHRKTWNAATENYKLRLENEQQ